MIHLPTSDL